jgi:hypothetical protein
VPPGGSCVGVDTIHWSATTCEFPGAGVYVGVAPDYEHMAIARALGHRQARLFVGARMRFSGLDRPAPVNYFAIRDPSAVRVVPVNLPPLPRGFRHVDLRFSLARNGGSEPVVVSPAPNVNGGGGVVIPAAEGFLVTVGLPIEREQAFFEKMVASNRNRLWSDVFAQLDEDCRPGK